MTTEPSAAVSADDGHPSRFERAIDRIPFIEKELLLLRRLVAPGDVCVDIGAAGGAHLLVTAQRVGPHGRVLGIEPRPGSLRILRGLVRAAGLDARVALVQVALSDVEGSMALRIPVVPTRAHLPGSSADRDAAAAFAGLPARTIEVPTRRLDDVIYDAGLDRVDVVKCDVEGAELAVFSGAPRLLAEMRPIIVVEADDLHQRRFDATAQDVLDVIVAYGYRPHRYRRGRLEPVAGATADEDDYVMVPEGRRLPIGLR